MSSAKDVLLAARDLNPGTGALLREAVVADQRAADELALFIVMAYGGLVLRPDDELLAAEGLLDVCRAGRLVID